MSLSESGWWVVGLAGSGRRMEKGIVRDFKACGSVFSLLEGHTDLWIRCLDASCFLKSGKYFRVFT